MRAARFIVALALAGIGFTASSGVVAQEKPRTKKTTKPKKAAPARKAKPARKAPPPQKSLPAQNAASCPKDALCEQSGPNQMAGPPEKTPAKATPFKRRANRKATPLTPIVRVPFQGILGVMVGKLTPVRRLALGAPPTAGLHVSRVLPGSLASIAGVKKKDVVIDVAGSPVRTVPDVKTALGQMNVGDLLTLQVIRNGKPKTLFATLGSGVLPGAKSARGAKPGAPVATRSLDGNFHFVNGRHAANRSKLKMRKVRRKMRRLRRQMRGLNRTR